MLSTVPYHKCSESEIRNLADPTKDTEAMLEAIIESETRSLYCLDWDKYSNDLSLNGSPESNNYKSISMILAPCNFIFPGIGDEYTIPE